MIALNVRLLYAKLSPDEETLHLSMTNSSKWVTKKMGSLQPHHARRPAAVDWVTGKNPFPL